VEKTLRGHRYEANGDEDMELVTAHVWVNDRLYEVDYRKAAGRNGWATFTKVYKSERQCRCPDAEALEHQRQEVRDVKSA